MYMGVLRIYAIALFAGLLLSLTEPGAVAEQRVALVIGNGSYAASPLANSPNDARDMAAALQECGFNVIKLRNCSRKDMNIAIRDFGEKIKGIKGTRDKGDGSIFLTSIRCFVRVVACQEQHE